MSAAPPPPAQQHDVRTVRHLRPTLVALGLLLVAGCNCGPAGAPAPTGVYRLTTKTISDTCTPRSYEGSGPLFGVTRHDGGVFELTMVHRWAAASAVRIHAPSANVYRDACEAVIGTEAINVEQDGLPLVVRVATRYEAAGCTPDGGAGALGACAIEQRLTYDLVQACRAPCQLREVAQVLPLVGPDVNYSCP